VDYGAVPVPDALLALYAVWGAGAEALPLLVVLFALALVLDRRALASAAPQLPALPGGAAGDRPARTPSAWAGEASPLTPRAPPPSRIRHRSRRIRDAG